MELKVNTSKNLSQEKNHVYIYKSNNVNVYHSVVYSINKL